MRALAILALILLLAACFRAPHVELSGAGVSEVVQRVKCEIAEALPDLRGEYNPAKPFHWLKYWTAKVDLELQTTDAGTITPTATYLDPPINFTLGIGGQLKTEALRNDKISFTVSVDELMDAKYLGPCVFARGSGLLGNLGLSEWIISALGPVNSGALTVGYHKVPNKTAQIFGPIKKAKEKKEEKSLARDPRLTDIENKIKEAENNTETARVAALKAREAARSTKVGRTYYFARTTADRTNAAEALLEEVKVLIWQYKKEAKGYEKKDEPAELAGINRRVKDVESHIATVKNAAAAAWELLPQDAPLDSITHQAKFTVTASVNATPNWVLERFRGPGQSGQFLNLSRQRLHDLTIVLGAPDSLGTKELSDEQRRQLLNSKINSVGGVILVQ